MKIYQIFGLTGVIFIAPHLSQSLAITAGIVYLILSLIFSCKDL